ncbi:MAG: hypothetical protein LUQ11_15095 [Methylococcaceae bacterium]|nr:hypothetical protein [Methylococcaceae bacterium]
MKLDFFKNLIAGARSALIIFPADDYIYPDRNGFRRDADKLSGDVKVVAKDMRKTLSKYHG